MPPSPENGQSASAHALGSGALIVTPTYNERYNLPLFLRATLEVAPGARILVVDDASPDGTGDVADELAAEDPRISVMHRAGKLGLGTAYVEGFAQGLAEGFERFIEMDTDLSHDPNYLPAFFAAFDRGADVVIGSRNVSGGGVEGWGVGRHVLSKGEEPVFQFSSDHAIRRLARSGALGRPLGCPWPP